MSPDSGSDSDTMVILVCVLACGHFPRHYEGKPHLKMCDQRTCIHRCLLYHKYIVFLNVTKPFRIGVFIQSVQPIYKKNASVVLSTSSPMAVITYSLYLIKR